MCIMVKKLQLPKTQTDILNTQNIRMRFLMAVHNGVKEFIESSNFQ
jgi:hypothetical protein